MLALHMDTAAGLSYGNRGGQRPPVFFALVSLHSCSFLAAQVGVGTMQLRAGLGGRGEGRKSSRPPERAGWMGTGVAPGVRHNPVFGSPGEEFPPLPLNPPSPPTNTQSPGARGTSWGS